MPGVIVLNCATAMQSSPFPLAAILAFAVSPTATEAQHLLHHFDRIELSDTYYSEGANAADLDNDGHLDAIYGPQWFAGPEFKLAHPIYKSPPQPRERYADHFFAWPYDFDGDAWVDVFTVGFPGTPAYVYQNPGKDGHGEIWKKHQVFDWVSNESPHFTDLVGDARPELVCTRDGFFGYATIDWEMPFSAWSFHKISPQIAPPRFGHGLGVGDINGDGRMDVIGKDGWFEQPASLDGDPMWAFHAVPFAPTGGAEMHAYDVDGDGDNDVITSLAAHAFGLSWWEQTPAGFKEHLIMGDRPAFNRYGVVFSELHSVSLSDMDGDGLKDIVTGKTYWSHHKQAPGWDDGAVVYWFKLVRGKDGVDWIPMQADRESGIGRQVVVKDVNRDGHPDIIVGGMVGGSVLIHRTQTVDGSAWAAAQPEPIEHFISPPPEGNPAPIDPSTGQVPGALEAEALAAEPSRGSAAPQNMANFSAAKWSAGAQLFWQGGADGDSLAIELPVEEAGEFILESAFTRAPDYAIVQLSLDGKDIGEPIDLFHFSKVTTTGVLEHSLGTLSAGKHKLSLRITGANPNAQPKRFVGIDYLRLRKQVP